MHRASNRRRLIKLAIATLGVLIAGATAWAVGMSTASADTTPAPTPSVSPTDQFPTDPYTPPSGDGSWWA
jgi:hypothetical protein